MVETSSDQTKAFLYALGVHVFAAVIMFAGLIFSTTPKTVVPKGVIDAVWVDMSAGRPLPKPKPTPTPEPRKPTPPTPPKPVERVKPEPVPPPPAATPDDVTDQTPLPPPVPDQEALNFERQREELRKQQEQARRQQELEEQRIQQLADIREQRAQAQAEREREEQALADVQEQQRADEPAPTPEPEGALRPGADVEDDLLGQYVGLILQVVTQNWRRPANTPGGIRCKLLVRQIPGGAVIGVEISSPCNADPLIQESIKDAVERASPLPYEGFDSVFQSALIFNFEYDG